MINAVNEQFSRFVNFAEDQRAKGAKTAIATMGDVAAKGDTPLEERNIKITDKSDWVGNVFLRKDDAKAISKEIGGSTWEFTQTTMNRLVKGAHVLGENDPKNTNVDNVDFNTSKLDLNI